MKNIALFSVIITALSIMSFTTFSSERFSFRMGSYGVCDCGDNKGSAPMIELTFNDDHTFHYVNNTDRSKPIDVKGKWTSEGKTIRLHDYKSEFAINDKWTMDDKCIKSRKGLLFTRICHKDCK